MKNLKTIFSLTMLMSVVAFSQQFVPPQGGQQLPSLPPNAGMMGGAMGGGMVYSPMYGEQPPNAMVGTFQQGAGQGCGYRDAVTRIPAGTIQAPVQGGVHF